MGAVRIFSKEGPIVDFLRGRPTVFFHGSQKWQNYISPLETKKTFFAKIFTFFWKITKIYLATSI